MDFSRFKALALSCAAAAVFVGCGGGDDSAATTATPSATLSGTAAGGAAIIGNVLVKDSLGATQGGTIDSTGHYDVNVSGMTAPFLLKAYGRVGDTAVTYCSAATSADVGGTINITPFTNLILSNLVGQIAENYFATSNPTAAAISTTAIAAQETALQAKLQLVLSQLGIDTAIDLLRSSFSADHSGIDAVMDLVKVDIDSTTGVASIKNAITNAVISTDNVTTSTDDSTPITGDISNLTTTAVTDLQAITTQMNAFAALFATTTPSVTAITNSGLFDTTNFMDMGMGFDQFVTELSTDQELIGFSFSNIDISLESATTGILTAVMNFKGTTFTEQISLKVIKINGVWKVQGDQTIADMEIGAQAINNVTYSSSSISNGLKVWINPFAYNASHASAVIDSALITGPGLGNGITMVQGPGEGLTVSGSTSTDTSHIPECSTTQSAPCVTLAQVSDNSIYRVQLYTGTTLLADYNRTLPKAPVATSTLSAASFPTITSFLVNGTAWTSTTFPQIVAGDTVGFTWTLPASLISDYISASAWGTSGEYYRLQKDLLAAETKATFSLGSTDITGTSVTNGGIWLSARDVFHRQFIYNTWF